MGFPVEVAAIHDASAGRNSMTVHVLGSGVRHDIDAEVNRLAENRGRERIVHNHRHAVLVGDVRKALEVQNLAGRVCDRFAEEALGVRAEGLFDFFVARVLVDERAFDAKLLHRHAEEVARTAVNGARANEVVARFADVEHRVEVRSLAGTREHAGDTAFEGGNLCSHGVVRRVLQTGVKIAFGLEVEEVGHRGAGLVFESRALVNGEHAGFAVLRSPTGLDA